VEAYYHPATLCNADSLRGGYLAHQLAGVKVQDEKAASGQTAEIPTTKPSNNKLTGIITINLVSLMKTGKLNRTLEQLRPAAAHCAVG
jgi:hypothetical protein